MEFCKQFNAATQSLEPRYADPGSDHLLTRTARSAFVTKTPPASYFLLKAAGHRKGSTTTGRGGMVGKVTMAQIRKIAEQKMPDLNATRHRSRRRR